jgi:hypothetical protein
MTVNGSPHAKRRERSPPRRVPQDLVTDEVDLWEYEAKTVA